MSKSNHRYPKRQRKSTNQNQDDNPPPPPPPPPPAPQPQLVVPPAGNNNNNNQVAIAGEPAELAEPAAALVVDPFTTLAARRNEERPLRAARNGKGKSISEVGQLNGKSNPSDKRLFETRFGVFGKSAVQLHQVTLECLYSPRFTANGTCHAKIRVPLIGGGEHLIQDSTNYQDEHVTNVHSDTCPCFTNNQFQHLNLQNQQIDVLNINATALTIFPRIGEFSTTNNPVDSISPDFSVLGQLMGKKGVKFMMEKMESSLGRLLEATVTAFANGTLGCKRNTNLKKTLRNSFFPVSLMRRYVPSHLHSYILGLMDTTSKALVWHPTQRRKIESFLESVEICRDTCRALFPLVLSFISDCGVVSYFFCYNKHILYAMCITHNMALTYPTSTTSFRPSYPKVYHRNCSSLNIGIRGNS